MSDQASFPQRAASWPARVKEYIEELQLEMKRVTWPSWKQVRATTGVVIAAIFAFGLYFAVIDEIILRAVKKIFELAAK